MRSIEKTRSVRFLICKLTSALEAVLSETRVASRWQVSAVLVLQPTCKTKRPSLSTVLAGDSVSISDHAIGFRDSVLQLACRLITRVSVIDVWQVDNKCRARLVTPKKRSTLVESLRHECAHIRNVRHFRESCGLGIEVCLLNLGAVGEVIVGVCGIIVDYQDVDCASWLNERPDWVV
jgi:hypothetical protein